MDKQLIIKRIIKAFNVKAKNLKLKLFSGIQSNQDKLLPILAMIFTMSAYGFLINYALFALHGTELKIKLVFGFGIVFFLITEEIPEMIKKCRGA